MRQVMATLGYHDGSDIEGLVTVEPLYYTCHALGVRWPNCHLDNGRMPDDPK